MYFEGKIIAFIIAGGRGETERKTRRDQEKKDRSASFPQAIIEQEKDEN